MYFPAYGYKRAFFITLFICRAGAAAADGVVLLGTRRSVSENGKSLALAEERTRRKDPLDDLNYYTGGWNISNEHYIAVRISSLSLSLFSHFVHSGVF